METEVFDFGIQRFLEIPRFDGVGTLGCIGVFSLRALDAVFVGNARASWPVVVKTLVAEGHVNPEAATDSARLWAFGVLIGNTDMHAGNLSFIHHDDRPYRLAPADDMLPMGFAPRIGGAIINKLRAASLAEVITGDIWRKALVLAEQFFSAVSHGDRFSANFIPCIHALHQHLDTAKSHIARLA